MKYTGVVDFDFLTLMQILAMNEEPTNVEFYDENAIFLGYISIANGWLKGASFKNFSGEQAFIELVMSQYQSMGTFRKVPYTQPNEKIAANNRIDALLLSAIADKETEDGRKLEEEKMLSSNSHKMDSATAFAIIDSYVSQKMRNSYLSKMESQKASYIIPKSLFLNLRHISNVFGLFNVESILLFKEISGYLVLFTEQYWHNLFPSLDPDGLNDSGIIEHASLIMTEIIKSHVGKNVPDFDPTFLTSEDILSQIDIVINEIMNEKNDVIVIKMIPGQSYDEDMSYVTGFSEESLKEPNKILNSCISGLRKN